MYIYIHIIRYYIYTANPLPLCDQSFACVPPPSPVQPRGRCKAAKPTNHWTWWRMENLASCVFLFLSTGKKTISTQNLSEGENPWRNSGPLPTIPFRGRTNFLQESILKKKGPVSNSDCEVHSAAWTQIFGCFHPLVSHQHHGATARYALGMSCRGKRTRSHKCFRAV